MEFIQPSYVTIYTYYSYTDMSLKNAVLFIYLFISFLR